jgi:hypothetical protein
LAAKVARVTSESFHLTIESSSDDIETIVNGLESLAPGRWDEEEIARGLDRAACIQAKYDAYLPDELLKKSFAAARLDAGEAAERRRELVSRGATSPTLRPALGRAQR